MRQRVTVGAMRRTTIALVTGGTLGGIGVLHIAWGRGSTWPFRDQAALAENVVGAETVPPPSACFAVAGALGAAAALVVLPSRGRIRHKLARAGVVTVLATRGVLGLVGRTDLVSSGSVSPTFRRRDRTLYAPLCLALAAGAAATVTR